MVLELEWGVLFSLFPCMYTYWGGGVGGERELYQILEEMKGHVNYFSNIFNNVCEWIQIAELTCLNFLLHYSDSIPLA